MSVTTETYRVQVTLATAVQAIPVTFYFLEQDDLIVYQTVAGVDTLMVLNTNYTLTGEGVEAGGTLTTIGGTVGAVWTIARADALTQSEEFIYSGSLSVSSIERAYDRLAMQIQRVFSMAKRALRFPITNAEGGELVLNDRKGKLLSFNSTTGALEYVDASSEIASAASAAAAEVSKDEAAASAAEAAASAAAAEVSKDEAAASAVESSASAVEAADSAVEAAASAVEAADSAVEAAASALAINLNSGSIPFAKNTQQFVFAGDSITAGLTSPNTRSYPMSLALRPPCIGAGVFTNDGVPGHNLTQMVARYAANIYIKRPAATGSTRSVLFVWIGANDYPTLWSTETEAAWVARLEAYWTTAKADGFFVVAFTIMDRTGATNDGYQMQLWRAETNRLIIERANALGIPVVDMDLILSRYITDATKFIDGSHPTDLGNDIIAAEASAVLMLQGKPLVPALRDTGKFFSLTINPGADAVLNKAATNSTSTSAVNSKILPATSAIGTGDFTFEAWVKPDRSAALGGATVYVFNSTGSSGFGFFSNTTAVPSACFMTPGSQYSRNYIVQDKWNHIAAVRSGTTLTYYVNGVATDVYSGYSSSIAAMSFYGDRRGMIARPRIYSRAFSAADVANSIQTLSAYNPLEASYVFALSDGCDNAGFQVHDMGPNGNHVLLHTAAMIVQPQKRGRYIETTVGNTILGGSTQVLPANARITSYSATATVGGITTDISTVNGTGTILSNTPLTAGLNTIEVINDSTGAGLIFCNAVGETIKHVIEFAVLDTPSVASAIAAAIRSRLTWLAGICRVGTGAFGFAEVTDSTNYGDTGAYFIIMDPAGDRYINAKTGKQVFFRVNNGQVMDISSGGLLVNQFGTRILRIKHGTATLVAGVVTVADTSVTANSRILINRFTDGGTVGASYSVTRTASTSFTVTAKHGSGANQTADTSIVAYEIIEP